MPKMSHWEINVDNLACMDLKDIYVETKIKP